MGMLLLAIFVVGSIAFSLWAWKSYDALFRKNLSTRMTRRHSLLLP